MRVSSRKTFCSKLQWDDAKSADSGKRSSMYNTVQEKKRQTSLVTRREHNLETLDSQQTADDLTVSLVSPVSEKGKEVAKLNVL
jgi:hypothetical protein